MQERAIRFVYEDHSRSYEQLLDKAKIPSLTYQKTKNNGNKIETIKIIN